jgi:hypothetical protein
VLSECGNLTLRDPQKPHSDKATCAYPVYSTGPKGWGSSAMREEYPRSLHVLRKLFRDEAAPVGTHNNRLIKNVAAPHVGPRWPPPDASRTGQPAATHDLQAVVPSGAKRISTRPLIRVWPQRAVTFLRDSVKTDSCPTYLSCLTSQSRRVLQPVSEGPKRGRKKHYFIPAHIVNLVTLFMP